MSKKKKRMEELEIIKTLRFSPIKNKNLDEAEAKALVKEYFREGTEDRWSLLGETYRASQGLSKEEWNKDTTDWFREAKPKIKIRKVASISGCMVGLVAELRYNDGEEQYGSIAITCVRERGPYEPDVEAPLLIEGKTVPPYIWGTRKKK